MSLSHTTSIKNQYFRVRTINKQHCVDYLIDQDKADSQIKSFLVFLRNKFRFTDEKSCEEDNFGLLDSSRNRIDTIKDYIEIINPKHRSYLKLRSLAAIEIAEGKPPYSDIHPMRAIFMIPTNPPPTFRNPEK